MTKFLASGFSLLIGIVAWCQPALTLVKDIPMKDVSHFSMDQKRNLFIADKSSNVTKYDSTGKELFYYYPIRPALPKSFDAENSTRIMVFYEARQEYLFLDWLLSPVGKEGIDLNHFGYISIVGQSANNMIWLLDNANFTLTKYDTRTKTKIVETNLEFLLSQELHPLYIKEAGNFLYISTEKNGIMVFDNLGSYKKKLPFDNVTFFDVLNEKMYWNTNGTVTQFNLLNFQTTTFPIGISGDLLIRGSGYHFLQDSGVRIYKKSQP